MLIKSNIIFFMSVFCSLLSANLYASNLTNGYAALEAKDYKVATRYFQLMIKDDPDSLQAKLGLAKVYKARGKKTRMQILVTDVLNITPNDIDALQLQGEIYLWSKDWKSAHSVFTKILKLDNQNTKSLISLAITLNALGKTEDADVIYNKIKLLQGTP